MRVTGYQLMDRLEELKEQARTIDEQFSGALYRFETEEERTPDPRALMTAYETCERKITLIQEAQARYNLAVTVSVLEEAMTLHRAVRMGSVVGRVKNQWKAASADKGINQYAMHMTQFARDKEHEYAKRVVEVAECLQLAESASRQAHAYKQAIRAGNATEVEIALDESVFA